MINAKNIYDGREIIINAFKNKIFPPRAEDDYFEDEDRFYSPKEVTPRNEILDFGSRQMFENKEERPRDMSELESEESAAQRRNHEGHELKTITPQQMFSRLPTVLAQSKAGNNSQKFKNEIRQLLYSLYRSKKLSKTIYNNLINAI